MSSIFEVVFGIAIGLSIGKLCTMLGEWLDHRMLDREERISRQHAAQIGIRRDMDLHPVEKGELW